VLANGLVDRGHDVTVIGTGSNGTNAAFAATSPHPPQGLGTAWSGEVELAHAARAHRIIAGLRPDIVHDHSAAGPLSALARDMPTVVTAHGPVDGRVGDFYGSLDGVSFVAISEAQRASAPWLPWVATVHNSIDLASYPFQQAKAGHVAFVGRMSETKGAHLAIDAARQAGVPILVAGKCEEPDERAYFDREIRPRVGPDVEWLGELCREDTADLYRNARALVCPVLWDEPFGLVMIEAMASGTPVVALRRGAVPEIVVDGRTGFICDSPAELSDAIGRVGLIDPAACRAHVEANFGPERMVQAYEAIYAGIVASPVPRSSS
jgi:glycosyltransferase involved in cell wall biosynthesis